MMQAIWATAGRTILRVLIILRCKPYVWATAGPTILRHPIFTDTYDASHMFGPLQGRQIKDIVEIDDAGHMFGALQGRVFQARR
jgi:hypothetical protein